MWALITFLVVGFIAGAIAKLLVSGPKPEGCLPTTVLGIVGSFIGGFLGYVIFDKNLSEGAIQTSGVLGSIVGSVIALLVYRRFAGDNR